MNKIFALIKASMTEDMNIFRVSTKKKNNFTKIVLPILIALLLMGVIYSYADTLIKQLKSVNMELVLLSIFIIVTSILTLVEGIYKSSNLLFNCKDDNLLLSLPISKRTVLFIRVFKFYVFELLYNSLFLLPAIIVYAIYMNPSISYYLLSLIGLLLFPIVPILFSCLIGTIIAFISSKFKGKNIVQTIITVLFLLGIMYFSYNFEGLILNIANNASSINDFITKIYYPAGVYIELIQQFSIIKLLEFIFLNLILFILTIFIIGKIYFKINSSTKSIKLNNTNIIYIIKTTSPIKALIKKEFSRFVNSTVFITNAGFGLVLHILACIFISIKFDSVANSLIQQMPTITLEHITSYMPVLLFGLICFSSFMTSITSSMISLEGKSINILKSLPIKPYKIVQSKVFAAILIMIPCILIGNIIIFIRFKFDLLSIFLILIATFLFPVISETIGIIINLKYPKMDAKNDTEVVKQSMSSSISVFIGIALLGITVLLLFKSMDFNMPNHTIMILFLSVYGVFYIGLSILLHKTCEKNFNNIMI